LGVVDQDIAQQQEHSDNQRGMRENAATSAAEQHDVAGEISVPDFIHKTLQTQQRRGCAIENGHYNAVM